jgi:hypothetical protein
MKRNFSTLSKIKKGYLYEEILPIVVSLIIIGGVLFTFSSQTSSAQVQYEYSAPTLKNQFPISFIQSFLYVELNQTQKKSLSINESTYFNAKDLLQREYGDSEEKIFLELRGGYIDAMKGKQLLHQYSNTPGAHNFGNSDNLLIRQEIGSLDSLFCLEPENYYFYLPYTSDISSKLVVIIFSDPICLTASQSYIERKAR